MKHTIQLFTPSDNFEIRACPELIEEHVAGSYDNTSIVNDISRNTAHRKIETVSASYPVGEDSEGVWAQRERRIEVGRIVLNECGACDFASECPAKPLIENEAGVLPLKEKSRRSAQMDLARGISNNFDQSILTGGVALRLHGIERSTSDIDIDFIAQDIEPEGEEYISDADQLKDYLKNHFVHEDTETGDTEGSNEDVKLSIKKETDEILRAKLDYTTENEDAESTASSLKIEVQFNVPDPKTEGGADEVVVIDGVRTYSLGKLLYNKVGAIIDRTKIRDFVDVSYILEKRPELAETIPEEDLLMLNARFGGLLERMIDGRDGHNDDHFAEIPGWMKEENVFESMMLQAYETTERTLKKIQATNIAA